MGLDEKRENYKNGRVKVGKMRSEKREAGTNESKREKSGVGTGWRCNNMLRCNEIKSIDRGGSMIY